MVKVDPAYISSVLGIEITPAEIAQHLRAVGCDVNEATFEVDPPSWRSDLLQPADFVEEVARMVGYEKIPSILPPRPKHASLTPTQKRRRAIATMLASRGFAEVQTFPFTNQEIIDSMGFVGERAATYRIANPMSEEFPLMRVHLVPGLIEVAQRNISRGAKDFAIFEMGSIFRSSQKLIPAISPELGERPDQTLIDSITASVPPQAYHVAGLLVGKVENSDWQGAARSYTWQDAIAYAEDILQLCNLQWSVKRSDFEPWHPGRCAELIVDGKAVAKLIVGSTETGDAIVKATVTDVDGVDVLKSLTTTINNTDASIDAVGKRVTAVASFSKGKTVAFYVNGEKKWSKLSASDADVVLNYNLKKGRNTVTVKISGGFVTTEVIVVK